MVLLDDGVEVSPAFYLLLKRFLLVTQPVESGAASPAEEGGAALASRAGLLGVALGRPAASAGGERDATRGATWRAGRRAVPSECGAMYLAAPWLELHEHVTDHLDDVLLKGAEGEAAQPADVSWAAMQRGFMEARDYSMLYLGVTLCRRQGDANTTLATEAEVEALLARDWSQLIAGAAGD